MPPVSVTMQARKLLPDTELDELGELLALPELDGALDELLPQAASSRMAAVPATPASSEGYLTGSSTGPRLGRVPVEQGAWGSMAKSLRHAADTGWVAHR
jgi:hypothetical protein